MSEAPGKRPKQEIGQPVAGFSLAPVGGGDARALQSFLDGKKGGVVVFWSSVCSHCIRYDDYFNSFCEHHPELGLVMVASRQGETAQQMVEAAAQRKLSFPILHDPGCMVARDWYTQQTPRCFLIAADGTLIYRGAIDNFKLPADSEYLAYLEPAIEAFLAGRPLERAETASFGCAIQSVYYILPKQL